MLLSPKTEGNPVITLGACVVLTILAVWGFMRSKALDKMALDAQIDGHVELANNRLKKDEPQPAEEADKKD